MPTKLPETNKMGKLTNEIDPDNLDSFDKD